MLGGVDRNLCWDNVKWIPSLTYIPLMYVKGMQCVEDAIRPYHAGHDGIVISDHRGQRLLGTSGPALDVLLEIHLHVPHILRRR